MIYQAGKFLRINYYGIGNVSYDGLLPNGAAPLTAAADGLSVEAATPSTARLGQDVGQAGDPGKLLEAREIPLNGFPLSLRDVGSVAGAHLKLIQSVNAAGIFEPVVSVINSTGTEIFQIRLTQSGSTTILGGNGAAGTATGGLQTIVGSGTGHNLTSGTRNTLVGTNTGRTLTTQNNETMFGYDLGNGLTAIGDNNVIMGAQNFDQALTMGAANLIIGAFINNAVGGNIGDGNMILQSGNVTGGLSNSALFMLNNAANLFGLSNVFAFGNNTHNFLFGQTPGAYADSGDKVQVSGNVKATGLKLAIRTSTTAADTFTKDDHTVLMDTTAGNLAITIDPTITGLVGNVKKKSGDLNSVTITPASGQIFNLGAPVASYSFNVQGESVQFQTDGTNIYFL